MKNKFMLIALMVISGSAFSQVGINTDTPQNSFHINGGLQVTKEFSPGGNATTPGDPGIPGQVLISDGQGNAPKWTTLAIPTLPTLATGTVISIDGQLSIAQEITVQMSADYTAPGRALATVAELIGNLTYEIIDNENAYQGNATTNSFKITQNVVYQVFMNAQLTTVNGTSPVIGIWDDTTGLWVARVNDYYSVPESAPAATKLQTYSLITAISLDASHTYSFRVANTSNTTIRQNSFGTTGSGPVTQVTLKRLK